MQIEIREDPDGSLTLQCGDGDMETDLVFALGAMHGDPSLEKQRAILNYIKAAVDCYSAAIEEKLTPEYWRERCKEDAIKIMEKAGKTAAENILSGSKKGGALIYGKNNY